MYVMGNKDFKLTIKLTIKSVVEMGEKYNY